MSCFPILLRHVYLFNTITQVSILKECPETTCFFKFREITQTSDKENKEN